MTKIEWTHRPGTIGESWNPIRARNKETGGVGHFCVKVSGGCLNCYAADYQKRFKNNVRYAAQDAKLVDVFLDENVVKHPLSWKKPRTIFVCSMTDLFFEGHDNAWIDSVLAIAALCPQHTFIVLTKRIDRACDYFEKHFTRHKCGIAAAKITGRTHPDGYDCDSAVCNSDFPLPNVWIGVSIEDQKTADERLPILLDTPAAIRFISAEPLLGPVDLTHAAEYIDQEKGGHPGGDERYDASVTYWNILTGRSQDYERRHDGTLDPNGSHFGFLKGVDWVICGGESGRKANPMHPEWAKSLRDQCQIANVPFFFKQWGSIAPLEQAAPVTQTDSNLTAWPDGAITAGNAQDHGGSGIALFKTTKKKAGRALDGIEHNAWPGDAA